MTQRPAGATRAACIVLVLATALIAAGSARAQAPAVDELLARVFASKQRGSYRLTADFNAVLTLHYQHRAFTALANGSFNEWQQTGEPKRRKVHIHDLRLPFLLRPFRAALKSLIEQRVETQSEDPSAFHAHDVFILDERADARYVLGGIRRDIVTEAIDRYRSSADKEDLATRRAVAKWLYTSPTMQNWIVRPGPPYALEALVDEAGLIYSLQAFYHWGRAGTTISYTLFDGHPVWREVALDLAGEPSIGEMRGQLVLTFANHCLNCP